MQWFWHICSCWFWTCFSPKIFGKFFSKYPELFQVKFDKTSVSREFMVEHGNSMCNRLVYPSNFQIRQIPTFNQHFFCGNSDPADVWVKIYIKKTWSEPLNTSYQRDRKQPHGWNNQKGKVDTPAKPLFEMSTKSETASWSGIDTT